MSGIVGIVHLDGAPIDDDQIERLTDTLEFRGPDARQTWVRGSAGFGHTWLRTTSAAEVDPQPSTLDGRAWVLADARLDARAELIDLLEAWEDGRGSGPVTDVALVARAYRAWGERCVEHLLGDFVLAVWDQTARRLFVARDQLGTKPLYYARLGSTLVFSNTLACVRRHPRVSNRLNDLAIADFLLFGVNCDLTSTSFADVRRLPPGHRATFSADGERVERHWQPPIDTPIRYRHAADYQDRFRELLDTSVRDRLPDGPLGVFMSGGLDSGTLAATACDLRRRAGRSADVHAFTTVWDGFDQDERRYAGVTAAFLRIPIAYHELGPDLQDAKSLLDRNAPEPLGDGSTKQALYHRSLSKEARVFFYGEGPDNILWFEWPAYVRYMLRRHQPGRLALDFATQAVWDRGRGWVAPLFTRIKQALSNRADTSPSFPPWLNPHLERRLGLRDRWREQQSFRTRPDAMRPVAHGTFDSPEWDALFQVWDSEATTAPFEVRQPFLDVRLIRYLLAVPTVPWCRNKALIRRSMRGRLPDEILSRKKSPLRADPFSEGARQADIAPLAPRPELDAYLDVRSVPILSHNAAEIRSHLRPYQLDHWLRGTSSMVLQGETE